MKVDRLVVGFEELIKNDIPGVPCDMMWCGPFRVCSVHKM